MSRAVIVPDFSNASLDFASHGTTPNWPVGSQGQYAFNQTAPYHTYASVPGVQAAPLYQPYTKSGAHVPYQVTSHPIKSNLNTAFAETLYHQANVDDPAAFPHYDEFAKHNYNHQQRNNLTPFITPYSLYAPTVHPVDTKSQKNVINHRFYGAPDVTITENWGRVVKRPTPANLNGVKNIDRSMINRREIFDYDQGIQRSLNIHENRPRGTRWNTRIRYM